MKSWFRRLSGLFGRARGDRDFSAELDAHLQAHIEDNMQAGMTRDDAVVSNSVADRRLQVVLIGTFGALALALAAIGLYGVMAYSFTQRTREMGIRMAIGASPSDVLALIGGRGMKLVGAGLAIGLCIAIPLAGSLDRFLFSTTPHDVSTFTSAIAVLLRAGALACYVPARRAMRVEPVVALRDE